MQEVWRAAPGYEGTYEVSDHGRVRSSPRSGTRGGVLKATDGVAGRYLRVSLYREGRREYAFIHRLVMAAFVGPKPAGLVTRHLDGDARNNRLDNLAYGTPRENSDDMRRHGTNVNANKIVCKNGHSYLDPANVQIRRGGGRVCRACQRDWARARKAAA